MKKIIILLGPTGVGKTEASILLARRLDTEIISSDSMQIYRHMDIGTAKPSQKELQAVRHHMIDIVEPWESYSTGQYVGQVRPIISGLHNRDKVPLVVGGTGLYIKAMTRGLFSGPSADWDLRNVLLEREKQDPGVLYAQLSAIDPDAALGITPADTRRVVRALEVCLKSDTAISQLRKYMTEPLPYEFIRIGLMRDRAELYRMIEDRVEVMFKEGLIEEVKSVLDLMKSAGKTTGRPVIPYPSMQAIGYKETALYLSGDLSLEDTVRLIKQRSRNYAKRQFTWFRKEEGIKWIDITGVFDAEKISEKTIKALAPEL
jgi:tRNA dimethylallyltransferase